MPSKEQTHKTAKAGTRSRAPEQVVHDALTSGRQHTHTAVVHRQAETHPEALTPKDVLQLQRAFGNQATARLLALTTEGGTVQRKENKTGLPDELKDGVEALSGLSLDDVKVHYNSTKPAELQASAYTQGTDIHVAPGEEEHLPHEAWHVVQQKRGRVPPTMQTKGTAINADRKLEREADVMGAKALTASRERARSLPVAQSKRAAGAGRQKVAPPVYPPLPAREALEVKTSASPLVQMWGNAVIQMLCEVCKSLGEDADHSPKKCPYLEGFEEEATPKEEKKAPRPAKEKSNTKKKEVFHDLGVSKLAPKVAPAVGQTVGALAGISKADHPDVYLLTLIEISNRVAGTALDVDTKGKTLIYGKGTDKETREHKVRLTGGGGAAPFVMIHYHPRATIPKGALSGESIVHVKGDRAAKYKGKYISSATLTELKLPVPAGHT